MLRESPAIGLESGLNTGGPIAAESPHPQHATVRFFLAQVLVASLALLVVMATMFRSQRARATLRFSARVATVYVLVNVGLALIELWRNGF